MKYVKSVSLSTLLILAVLFFSQAANASLVRFHVFESDLSNSPAQQSSDLFQGEEGENPWWTDEPLWTGDPDWKNDPNWRADPAWSEDSGWQENPWWLEPGIDKAARSDVVALFSGESVFTSQDSGTNAPPGRSGRRGNDQLVRALRREYMLAWKIQWLFQKHSDEQHGIDIEPPAVIPVPAAVWLMVSGLGLLGLFRRRVVQQ